MKSIVEKLQKERANHQQKTEEYDKLSKDEKRNRFFKWLNSPLDEDDSAPQIIMSPEMLATYKKLYGSKK